MTTTIADPHDHLDMADLPALVDYIVETIQQSPESKTLLDELFQPTNQRKTK